MATVLEGETRSSRKKLASARSVVGLSEEVVAYGSGIGHTRATKTLVFLGLGYLAAFLAFRIFFGLFLIPGILLFLVGYYLVRPLRGMAVTSFGILVMHEGLMNGQPTRVLYVAPREALGPFDEHLEGRHHVRVQIGPELIRMRQSVYESLVGAVQRLSEAEPTVVQPSAAGPGWFADPLARYQFRYWDGETWTAHVSHNGTVCLDSVV